MRIAALLLVVLLALPVALAQVPPAPASPFAASVAVEAPATAQVATDTPLALTVTVRNTAASTNPQVDQQRTVYLAVSGAPSGWNAAISQPDNGFQLGPGQSATTTLTLSVAPSASTREARITVSAKMLPLGASSAPAVGSTVDPEATASATVVATRQDEPLRAFVETVGPAVLVAGISLLVFLVLVLIVVAARRRSPLRLEVEPAALTVRPGTSGTVSLTVRNSGRRAESVILDGAAARGWEVEVPEHIVELAPGAEHTVGVVVAASKRASASELVLVAVAQRQGATAARLTIPLTLE